MTISVIEVLETFGHVERDALARSFAARYDFDRAYGPAMHRVLRRIAAGTDWREVAGDEFEGQGSYGNGAAMRVAPLGVWFADDLEVATQQAAASAAVTHAHSEAAAGAIAVAVAAALAWRGREEPPTDASTFLRAVAEHTPSSDVADRLRRAARFSRDAKPAFAAAVLGSGAALATFDTVPFALWVAARCLDDFVAAMWTAASEATDVDTVCAIAGGVVASRVGTGGLPGDWLALREPLPGAYQ